MSYLARLKGWLEGDGGEPKPHIIVFGDSHTVGLLRAQELSPRAQDFTHIKIVRVLKTKGKKQLGDMDFDDFRKIIKNMGPDDFVFSAIGGNQYAIVSTVQDAVDFDFLVDARDDDVASDRAQIIPMRAMKSFIETGVLGNDAPVLEQIRRSTKARVFHLLPPPPKEDNDFISRYFESRFAGQGMEELGPSRPSLRLKTWLIQAACLGQVCEQLGIELLGPPRSSRTAEGFLKPKLYAKDVTHANRGYGEMVLDQILEITGAAGTSGATR